MFLLVHDSANQEGENSFPSIDNEPAGSSNSDAGIEITYRTNHVLQLRTYTSILMYRSN